ncbi:MAG: outer membrane lipoprotein chaperone LolA [Gammaproteobacteria bacterium]|nr:outer membrane lipoprotein chaperone LolA [Gammaproteobacteria bacterium]
MKLKRVVLGSLLLVFALPTLAADKNEILTFFKSLNSFSAEFEQTIEKSQLAISETSRGKLFIQKPGKFRWDYALPYEQQIVSNGKKVWIYDVDLGQVTVKPMDKAIGNTPALLLSSEKALEQSFTVGESNTIDGIRWTSLKPKDTDAGFNEILMGFSGKDLKEMMLVDNLDQVTRVVFTHFQRNPQIPASTFEFQVPKGADVFDTSQ